MLPHHNGRNRTFWAFDYEGRREVGESVQTAFFPPDSFRSGDFSALLTPAINPATGKPFRSPIRHFRPFDGRPVSGQYHSRFEDLLTGLSYVGINSVVPDGPAIGQITSLHESMRIIQLGLKLSF